MSLLRNVFGAAAMAALACSSGNSATQPVPVCTTASAQPVTLSVGQFTTLDPTTGSACYGIPANASATDSAEYLLVPWSAARAPNESLTFLLTTNDTKPTAQVVRRMPAFSQRRSIARDFDAWRLNAGRTGSWPRPVDRTAARRSLVAPPALAAADSSPGKCTPLVVGMGCQFVVCDTVTCQTRVTVGATLQALGQKVAIFVDRNAAPPPEGLSSSDLTQLQQLMDSKLYAIDTVNFGRPSDIDGNGRVLVLMTPIVNQLVTQQECETVGFILGFFFGADLDPRFNFMFNKGEIYYSLVADSTGQFSCPHPASSVKRLSPRTFVHELQHLINFSQHVVGKPTGSLSEEGWLDEGLSTYAEEITARTYVDPAITNPIDTQTYRRYLVFGDMIDAWYYLSNPDQYYLEIPEDNGTVGEIGASWLFVRYLVDQYGAGLTSKLANSTLYGSANIMAQTGADFTTLVNQWAIANYVNDYPGFPAPPKLKYTSWGFRSAFDTLQRSVRTTFADSVDFTPPYPLIPLAYPANALSFGGTLRAGSGFYLRMLQGPKDPAAALLFATPSHYNLSAQQYPRLNIVRMR